MCTVEMRLKNHAQFPRIYQRYVDDCFAVVEVDKIHDTLELLNSVCPEIQFTCETEQNNTLPFLDLSIHRTNNGTIEFDIYRKSTCTDRFIPIESNHHPSHKIAAFNSMIHRLVNVPLSPEKFAVEKQKIIAIGDTNGVSATTIDSTIKKHQRKKLRSDCTVLCDEKKQNWCRMTYDSHTFNSISKSLCKENIALAPSSNTKLKSLLNSTKDKQNKIDLPGVYRATCSHCSTVYIGQTRRSLKVRMREHLNDIRNCDAYKSGLAEHIITERHRINEENFNLIEREANQNRLNILESFHIYVNKNNNVNRDAGQHYSSLFSAYKN